MSSYRTPERTGNTTTPTPDAAFPTAAVVASLRDRVRTVERQAAVACAERTHAQQSRDDALAELAAVRRILAEAVGGESAVPPGSSTVDLATAVIRDLLYARGSAARAHGARRVAEATVARLVEPAVDAAPTRPSIRCAHSE